MILPSSPFVCFLLILFGVVCWGSWVNTFKLGGKWRFELYYFDFAVGMLLAATVSAFTLGSLGFDGFLFMDDILQTGKRNLATAVVAGMIFNLGNMLLLGGVSIVGMSAALPMGLGLAALSAIAAGYVLHPSGNAVFLFGGAAVVTAAAVFFAISSQRYQALLLEERAKAGLLKTSKLVVSPKAVIASMAGGGILGISFPLLDLARTYGPTMGPYAASFMFAMGVFLSTFVLNLFFMNLPLQGAPVEIRDYFIKGSVKSHLLGLGGGIIWHLGLLSIAVAAAAEPAYRTSPSVLVSLPHAAALVAFLYGALVWKEYARADSRVKNMLTMGLVLFAVGLILVAIGAR